MVAAQLSLQPHSGKALLQGLNLSQLNAVRRAQARHFSAAIEPTAARQPSIAGAIVGETARLIPSVLCGLACAFFVGTALMMFVHFGNWLNGTQLSDRETGQLAMWIIGATWLSATVALRAKVFCWRR